MAVAQADTTHLVQHVPQLHLQDMLLLTPGVAVAQADTTHLGILVWHPQKILAMPSFLVAVAVPAATTLQARVV